MGSARIAVICTVRNEESSIALLLDSLRDQTRQPDEIVIVDGGSCDRTIAIIEGYARQGMRVQLINAPGLNIAAGRNLAIKVANAEIIAGTDAGVRLSKNWLAELLAPFTVRGDHPPADVVAGFFRSDPKGLFEEALGATTLPHLEDIHADTFLPSSRSVAFRKEAWRAVGGYPEWLDYCEDVVFDLALRSAGFRFGFAPAAMVAFRPRGNLRAFFWQYYRYARGDGKAGLWPRRHLIRYASYAVGALALVAGFWYKVTWFVLAAAGVAYLYQPYRRLWPALEHRPVPDRLFAVSIVPVVRLAGDAAKMMGYPVGVVWRLRRGGRRA